jgi:hypothetical protein
MVIVLDSNDFVDDPLASVIPIQMHDDVEGFRDPESP